MEQKQTILMGGPVTDVLRKTLAGKIGWEPPAPPTSWQLREERPDGAAYQNDMRGLFVIVSVALELDGKHWLHFSMSHKARPPRWRELVECKDLFIGDVNAYQVLPVKSKYVNIHPNTLHLWHCFDGDPLPDLTQGGGSI